MRPLSLLLALALCLACTPPAVGPGAPGATTRVSFPFDWKFRGSDPIGQGRNGLIATADLRATRVGLEVLRQGGNAADAAVAVGFALAVVLPEAGQRRGRRLRRDTARRRRACGARFPGDRTARAHPRTLPRRGGRSYRRISGRASGRRGAGHRRRPGRAASPLRFASLAGAGGTGHRPGRERFHRHAAAQPGARRQDGRADAVPDDAAAVLPRGRAATGRRDSATVPARREPAPHRQRRQERLLPRRDRRPDRARDARRRWTHHARGPQPLSGQVA